MTVDRRTFIKGSAVAAAAVAFGGPFQGYVARAAGPGGRGRPIVAPPLAPVADLRDGVNRLKLPPGFQYRSFQPTGAPMADGTVPGNHDGMAAFAAGSGNVLLIRNHERNGSGGAFTGTAPVYDERGPGGDTYVIVDLHGNVVESRSALRGTQMNCAGGAMPWGSWITCEETINGPDVFDDFTRNIPNPAPNGEQTYIQNKLLTKTHGYLFEVPTIGAASAMPITQAGRFAHEAAEFDPMTGCLYLTEDDFGYGSGFYRYVPPVDPREAGYVQDGGTLWMLAVVGKDQANLSGQQQPNRRYKVRWVQIENPDPQFPMVPDPAGPAGAMMPTTTNNLAINNVGKQGWDAGGAVFSRLEGIRAHRDVLYFTATQGGGDPEVVDWVNSAEGRGGFGRGLGQVWAYHPKQELLEVVYQSHSTDDLHLPDNVTVSKSGTLVLCEDNAPPTPTDGNKLQALTARGQLISIAEHLERPAVEWAGATFSPNGATLYANLNTSSAMSVAIWGPWETVGV
jgi:secreted PhoX family phosphatase